MAIPTKRNAVRSGLLLRSVNPETDVTAEEFNELVARLEAAEAGVAGSSKKSVRAATVAAGTLATSFAHGQTIDGVVLAEGDRILVKDQADASENGIYVVAASGTPTRPSDADGASDLEDGCLVPVEEGTQNADTLWTLSTDGEIELGTTDLGFTRIGADNTLERVSGFDDFTENPALAWAIDAEAGGEAEWGDNAGALGLPGSGFLKLKVTGTENSRVMAVRANAGLVRDTDKPIVIGGRLTIVDETPEVSDDECAWLIGGVDQDLFAGNGVFLFAPLDGGRVFKLAILTAGTPAYTDLTLPALGAEDSYRIRLTILPGSVLVEAAVNLGAFATIATVTAATPAVVYHPLVQNERSDGAGNRSVVVDYVEWSGYRDTSAAAASAPYIAPVSNFATGDDVATVASDLAAHDGAGGAAHANAVAAGAAGFMTGADKSKLDGIEASADVTDDANVRAALAAATADVAFNAKKLTGVADPASAQDAATKAYVDAARTNVVTESSDTHTFADADAGKTFRCTHASGCVVTVPSGLTPGTSARFIAEDADSAVSVVGSSLTLRHGATFDPETAEQYSSLVITILDSDEALVEGDLAPA